MRDPGKPQISQVPALAVAHSPTAIPAENQAPKIALRLSPRRCSKARQSWPGFRPATLLPFWNLDTGLGLAMELCILCRRFAFFAYFNANKAQPALATLVSFSLSHTH